MTIIKGLYDCCHAPTPFIKPPLLQQKEHTMEKTQKNIYSSHAENSEWLNKLFFYKDEIALMQKRLEEVCKANTGKEVLAGVEHFQNQLIIQRDNIDRIKHEIGLDEKSLEKNVNDNPVAVDHRKVNDHAAQREAVTTFENNFNELRTELKTFLSKWL